MARLALTALLATAVVAVLGQEIELGQPYDEEAEERFGPLDYDLLGEGVGGDGSGIVDEDDNASNRTTRSPSNATTSTALISTTVTTATTTTTTTTTTASTSATTTTTTSITSTTHTTSTTITKFCHAGQYLNKAENRCEPCLEGTYQDENGDASKGHHLTECMPWIPCPLSQTEDAPPTLTSQRTCVAAPREGCERNQYKMISDEISGSGDSGTDDGVADKTICGFTEKCPKGFAIVLNATADSDVLCTSCDDFNPDNPMFFSTSLNSWTCKEWQTCKVGEYWVQPSGSTTEDIDCKPCPPGKIQLLENNRKTECLKPAKTTPARQAPSTVTYSTVTLFPGTDGSGGSGSGDALPSGNSKLKLGVLISIACGGTIVLLTIVAVVRGKCKRQAIYLTANEWSDNSRNWQGGFNDDDDDQILLGGL